MTGVFRYHHVSKDNLVYHGGLELTLYALRAGDMVYGTVRSRERAILPSPRSSGQVVNAGRGHA